MTGHPFGTERDHCVRVHPAEDLDHLSHTLRTGNLRQLTIMVTAVIIAVGIMMMFADPVSDFVHRHPTVKMLALSFLLLIGVMLVAEGFHQHVGKGYVYFAMGFSMFVEAINMRVRGAAHPVTLHEKIVRGA